MLKKIIHPAACSLHPPNIRVTSQKNMDWMEGEAKMQLIQIQCKM